MAIEFAQCIVYSRSQGKNAVRAAAYRSASKLFDERSQRWFDFSKKPNVAHSEILLPEGADKAFLDREYLWNQVEQVEKRRDSQLAKDYILALPKELTLEQNIELARQFAHDHFVSKGLVVDMNIHWEDGNPHAHLFVTTRRLLGKTFSLKARDLNPEFHRGVIVEKDGLNTKWRGAQDQFFINKGIDLEVDPNHLVPTRHRGRKIGDGRADYIDEDNTLRAEMERELALTSPESILNIMSKRHGAFTERQLETVIKKATQSEEECKQVMSAVLQHSNIFTLGPGDDGRIRYTSCQDAERVWKAEDQATSLSKTKHHAASSWRVKEQFQKYTLNEGQKRALEYVLEGEDLSLIVGKAGTGKSYLMNAAREVWQAEGYRVLGIAVAGIASESLESSSNIKSSTIASFLYKIEKGKLTLSDKDVIVLDEAGMGDDFSLCKVFSLVSDVGAKLVMIGDPEQTQSPGAGALYRALLDRIGFVELTENMRQKRPEDRIATNLLSTGRTAAALDIYAHKGQVFLSETEQDNLTLLMSKWSQHVVSGGQNKLSDLMRETLIFAHRNEDVAILNKLAREQLITAGMLKGEAHRFTVKNHRDGQRTNTTKNIELMVGERILFLENSWKLNVKNGHFATITEIKGSMITAVIGGGDKARTVKFDAKDYQDFDYGYAATIHKTQGVTIDTAFLYAGGKYWSRNLAYVGLSRHRYDAYVFADKESHRDFETLKKHLGRLSIKDSIIDFPLNYAMKKGVDPESALGYFYRAIGQVKSKAKDAWAFVADYEAFNAKLEQVQKDQAKTSRREDAIKVAHYADLSREIGRAWSEMKRTSIPGKELSDHADFSKNYDLIVERNKQAHELYNNAAKYELAMELNDVSLAELKRHSESHEARERVLAYEALAKKGSSLEAGRMAEEIRTNGRAHGQFVRERGLGWDAINKLGKSYTERTLLYSLDPIERERHRQVMSYLAQGRDNVAIFKRKNPDPKLALFPTSERNAETKALRVHITLSERDKLAYHLFTHQDQYAKSIEHFKIPLDKLGREAKRHEYRESILAFIEAEQGGHELLKQNIAYNIKAKLTDFDTKKICGSVIKELELLKGMTWEKIHLNAWAYGERRKGYASPEQKAAIQAYAAYRACNRDLGKAVGRNQPNDNQKQHPFTPEQEKAQRTLKYQRIKALVNKRDQAADQLWGELVNLDERSLKKLDIPRLQKESENHHRRIEVKTLKGRLDYGEMQSLQTQLTAKTFAENPLHDKLLKEQKINYKVNAAIKSLAERRHIASLNQDERTLYLEAKHYQTLSYQSAKAWKRSFAKAQNAHALVQQVKNTQVAQAFTDQRNEIAFKINQNLAAYEPHLQVLGIDRDKLAKAANKYGLKQKYENNVQHYRSLLMSQNKELKSETFNADRISEALIDMGETFYQKVLGDLYTKPKRYNSNIRVGEKAFFSFQVSGSNRGAWHSFESGEGGYPIQLLMNANYGYGLNFEDALKEGARIAGLSDNQAKDITYKRKQKSTAEIEAEARLLASEKQKKIETARYYCKTSLPIEGTLAERYLRETRKIEGDLSGFRYHPRVKDPQTERYYPAALIAAKDEQGRITAVQTILIDPNTVKKANVEVAKRTRGAISGSAALIHQGTSNKVFIAEGPETAASLIKAVPDANIYVTVGNIRNSEHLGYLAKKHNTDTFYFAADNDGDNLKPIESLQKAVAKLEAQGIKCYKAAPQLKEVEKPDFNDVIIHQGTEGVKTQLNTMHRIINESEKINLGLVEQKAQKHKPEIQTTQKPDFWIAESKVRLSKPLLTEVQRYATINEQWRTDLREVNHLVINHGNPERINQLKESLKKTESEKLAISTELMKQEALWKQVDAMNTRLSISDKFNNDALKMDAKYNFFEAKNLQLLKHEANITAQSHARALSENQNLGKGRSV